MATGRTQFLGPVNAESHEIDKGCMQESTLKFAMEPSSTCIGGWQEDAAVDDAEGDELVDCDCW